MRKNEIAIFRRTGRAMVRAMVRAMYDAKLMEKKRTEDLMEMLEWIEENIGSDGKDEWSEMVRTWDCVEEGCFEKSIGV